MSDDNTAKAANSIGKNVAVPLNKMTAKLVSEEANWNTDFTYGGIGKNSTSTFAIPIDKLAIFAAFKVEYGSLKSYFNNFAFS